MSREDAEIMNRNLARILDALRDIAFQIGNMQR